MASRDIAANVAIDPENRLFWRMPRQRLEAEAIRDVILAAAGIARPDARRPERLPVHRSRPVRGRARKRNWPGKPDDDPSTWRRSLYVFSKRSIRYPFFEAFDQPNLVNSTDRRNRSTVAPQALLLMNNAFVLLQAKKFAEAAAARGGRRRRPRRSTARSASRWRGRRTRSSGSKAIAFVAAGRPAPRSATCSSTSTSSCTANERSLLLEGHRPAALAPRADLSGSAAASPAWPSPTCSAANRLLASRAVDESARAEGASTSPPRPRRSSRSSATAASARSTRSIRSPIC